MTRIRGRRKLLLVHSVVGPGDAELLRALVRGGQKASDPARDGILRQRRIREAAELLEARLAVLEAEPAGSSQVLGHLVAEDLERALHPLPGGHGCPGGAAQVRVVEV